MLHPVGKRRKIGKTSMVVAKHGRGKGRYLGVHNIREDTIFWSTRPRPASLVANAAEHTIFASFSSTSLSHACHVI